MCLAIPVELVSGSMNGSLAFRAGKRQTLGVAGPAFRSLDVREGGS
jgi:hypothetical protein